MKRLCVAAVAALVPLQAPPVGTPAPQNGTATNETTTGNETNVSAPGASIENGTQETVDLLGNLWPDWLPTIPIWLVRLVLALVVLVLAWYLSKLVVRLLSRRVARRFRRPSVVQTVLGSVRATIMLLAAFVAAGIAGVLQVGELVLSATVLTGATILVLTPIISSVVNGLLILADQPYEIGDMIEFAETTDRTQVGQRGFVEDVTLRYTKIFTLDNTFIVIPNGTIRDRDVINYSAEDPRTQLSLDVLVTYEGDLKEARELIERAARRVDVVVSGGPAIRIGSARYPAAPTCYINEFADHGVLLTLRYWARKPYRLLTVRSAVQENVWAMLDDADVEMAYPHSHVHFDETSGMLPVSFVDRDGYRPGRLGASDGHTGETDSTVGETETSGPDGTDGSDERGGSGDHWQGRRPPPSRTSRRPSRTGRRSGSNPNLNSESTGSDDPAGGSDRTAGDDATGDRSRRP